MRPKGVEVRADVIRARRLSRGLSTDEAAKMAGVTPRTVRTAEKGGPVSPDTLQGICRALDLPIIAVIEPSVEEIRGSLARQGFLAPPLETRWFGRADQLDQLQEWQDTGERVVVIAGPPGAGKSALARQLAEQTDSDLVVWVRARFGQSEPEIHSLQHDIATAFGIQGQLPDVRRVEPQTIRAAFRASFPGPSRALLVLDDCASIQMRDAFVGSGFTGRAIITTRHRHVSEDTTAPSVTLAGLDDEHASKLLVSYVGAARAESDPAGVAALCASVARLPRALHAVGAALSRQVYELPSDYVAQLESSSAGATAWLDRAMDNQARAALGALSIFEQRPFSQDWAATAIGYSGADTRKTLSDLTERFALHALQPDSAGAEQLFQLDETTALYAATLAANTEAVTDRLISFAMTRAGDRPTGLDPFARSRGLWDLVVEQAHGDIPAQASLPEVPDDLPSYPNAKGRQLGELIAAAKTLIAPIRPSQLEGWLAAALIDANGSGDAKTRIELYTAAAWTMAMSIRGLPSAIPWCQVACQIPVDANAAMAAVSARIISGRLLCSSTHYRRGVDAMRSALDLATTYNLGRVNMTLITNDYALTISREPLSSPGWETAERLLAESYQSLRDEPADADGLLTALVAFNLATVRVKRGRQEAADDLAVAVSGFWDRLSGSSPLLVSFIASHGAGLGFEFHGRSGDALSAYAVEMLHEGVQACNHSTRVADMWLLGGLAQYVFFKTRLNSVQGALAAEDTFPCAITVVKPSPSQPLFMDNGHFTLILDLATLIPAIDDAFITLACRLVRDISGPGFIIDTLSQLRSPLPD